MVQYVAGGVDVINNFFYAQPTEKDIQVFQQNHQSYLSRLGSNISETATNFYNAVVDKIATINYDSIKDFTRAVERKIFGFWENDEVIIPLNTLADLQFPPRNMIRWLMANPSTRTLYHKNLCAGYDDKYVDLSPGEIGDNHRDYQIVMQGIEYEDEDSDDVCYATYDDNVPFDDGDSVDMLSHSEQLDIISSWNLTNYYLEKMEDDPTSQYSGML